MKKLMLLTLCLALVVSAFAYTPSWIISTEPTPEVTVMPSIANDAEVIKAVVNGPIFHKEPVNIDSTYYFNMMII